MIRSGLLAAVLSATTSLVALAQTAEDLKNDANTPDDVLVYGMGYQGQRYSPLTQINKQNVGKLVPVWSYSLNDLQGGEGRGDLRHHSQCDGCGRCADRQADLAGGA
jgi:alcohol dehydrogenase (cytochrome c)